MVIFQIAALLDLVPVLRRLPDAVLPIKRHGKVLHQQELKLFKGLFLQAKQGLKDGTAKVREFTDAFPLNVCMYAQN